MDKLTELYERYKHLDKVLSEWGPDNFKDHILSDLWQAIKRIVMEKSD